MQSIYTADPAPLVHEGTVYLYTGHDEDDAPDNRYRMRDYRCFSTTDMVNWTDHGAGLDIRKVFHWSGGDANAAQCIYRNGKFYYYVSTGNTKGPGGVALGVAVSESPFGPFKDALGHALVTNDQTKYARHGWDDLDPTVFIDDDGRAFLYWGNNACYFAELNEDMISLNGGISFVPLNEETFGPDFEEAPWLYKRNGLYYLVYSSGLPESIRYATSKSPAGPWAHRGLIMDRPKQRGLITNHPGVIDFKGNSYLFYHTAALPRGGDKRRCVCVEQFSYNEDGSIPKRDYSKTGIVKGVAKLDPFARTEAETIAWASGVETAKRDDVGVFVTDIDHGDYIKDWPRNNFPISQGDSPIFAVRKSGQSPTYSSATPKVRDVDFGDKKAARFRASVAATAKGGTVELRLNSETGPLIGTLEVEPTGGMDKWAPQSSSVTGAEGVHDLYFKFVGSGGTLMNFDWWKFE